MKKKKQMKMWVLVVSILAIILVVGGGVILYTHLRSINDQKVAYRESMVEQQQQLEADFDLEGFTIDEPQVILNPYGNSPLTALIAFDTEEEVEVKVTIPGKMSGRHIRILFLKELNIGYRFMVFTRMR